MRNIIILIVSLLFTASCTTQRKAEQWYRGHSTELAKLCHECFPVKKSEVIEGKIIYLPSDTVYTASVDTVTVTADCPDGTKVKTKCPPCVNKEVIKKVLRVDTIKVEDTAHIKVLEDEVRVLEINFDKEHESKKMYRKYFFITLGLVCLYLLFVSVKSMFLGRKGY